WRCPHPGPIHRPRLSPPNPLLLLPSLVRTPPRRKVPCPRKGRPQLQIPEMKGPGRAPTLATGKSQVSRHGTAAPGGRKLGLAIGDLESGTWVFPSWG